MKCIQCSMEAGRN